LDLKVQFISTEIPFSHLYSQRMIFLLSLLLIIVAECLFLHGLLEHRYNLLACLQGTVFIGSVCLLFFNFQRGTQNSKYRAVFTYMGLFIASGIPALAYLIPGLSYLILDLPLLQWIGWSFSILIFLGILYGIQFGRWNWKVHQVTIYYPNLPSAFDGLRFVQISDVHVGSFLHRYQKVQKAIDLINQQNADYVFFTGDLVNNKADEMHGWEPLFSSIKAKKGKFSILGNHDYGDYVKWGEQGEKQENLDRLIEYHRAIGFKPLLNEAVELGEGFWLLGVENWGKAPFRQSGKLKETLSKIPNNSFKILLSHDPSHFDEQVLDTNIDLTLSGHTHGMQFGIERFGIKFSPVSFKYPKWAGLYQVGKQYLYVNRGFGFLGFPGRVGIYPEITHFTLKKSEH
jgi:predicted MPP superfamily phosphohydrolase